MVPSRVVAKAYAELHAPGSVQEGRLRWRNRGSVPVPIRSPIPPPGSSSQSLRPQISRSSLASTRSDLTHSGMRAHSLPGVPLPEGGDLDALHIRRSTADATVPDGGFLRPSPRPHPSPASSNSWYRKSRTRSIFDDQQGQPTPSRPSSATTPPVNDASRSSFASSSPSIAFSQAAPSTATSALVAVNIALYAISWYLTQTAASAELSPAPALGGVDPRVLVRLGAKYPPLIFVGQWWRLVTSIFVHVSLLHLLLNMWCLWNLGVFGEPLLGRPGLIAVYLLTGVAGMLQSLMLSVFSRQLQHGEEVIVAGASGAIFGIAGILIVLLSNRRLALPWEELRSLRRQVVFFALVNLVIGLAPGALPALPPRYLHALHLRSDLLPHIDNSAHVGGLICGLALGWPLMPRMTLEFIVNSRSVHPYMCFNLINPMTPYKDYPD